MLFGIVFSVCCLGVLLVRGMSHKPFVVFLSPIFAHFLCVFVFIKMLFFVSLMSYPLSQNWPRDRSGCSSVGRIVAVVVDWWRG